MFTLLSTMVRILSAGPEGDEIKERDMISQRTLEKKAI